MSDELWRGLREGCGTCHFGKQQATGTGVECRYNPPVLIVVTYSTEHPGVVEERRPWLNESDWCGKYKRNGSDEVPT